MTNRDDPPFQPGWSTPIVVDHRKPTLVAWFLRVLGRGEKCLVYRQGRCPGPNQCHDCAWSEQRSAD